jgi:hypothetical protein
MGFAHGAEQPQPYNPLKGGGPLLAWPPPGGGVKYRGLWLFSMLVEEQPRKP